MVASGGGEGGMGQRVTNEKKNFIFLRRRTEENRHVYNSSIKIFVAMLYAIIFIKIL